jgi:hypothetical protein
MILTWLLSPILSVLSTIVGVLPDADTTRFGGYGEAYPAGTSPTLLTAIHNASYFVPMGVVIDCLVFSVGFTVAAFVFQLAQWGYRELPDILGIGPS